MQILPSAVLFCCTMNELRSPMAEGLMKRYHGGRVFVDSVGVCLSTRSGCDPLMLEAMAEVGIDMARHRPKLLSTLTDDSFDVVIALSEEARAEAERLTRYWHCELRIWKVPDPTMTEGPRAARLAAYRQLRDDLRARILDLFPPA